MDGSSTGRSSWREASIAFLLWPSSFEENSTFRRTLTQVAHTGLWWGGLAALVGLAVYVAVEITLLGRPVVWFQRSTPEETGVVLLTDVFLAGLCLATVALPRLQCSLEQCRAWAATGMLLASGIFLRSDLIQGVVEIEFVALLYLLIVVVVPFQPWQVVGLGAGLGGVMGVLQAGVLVPDSAVDGFHLVSFLPSLGFATILASLVGGVLYGTRLTQHQERQQAQAVLRRSRDLLRRTQTVAKVGGWEYDPDTDTLWGTEQAFDLLGLPAADDRTLDTLVQAFAPEAQEELRAVVSRCVAEQEPFDRELPRQEEDGTVRWFRTRGKIRSEESGDLRVAGTVEEVTQRRALEQQLRDREEWIRSITENVPDGICRSDPEEGLVYVNQAFSEMLGYDDPGDLHGMDPVDLYAEPETTDTIDRMEGTFSAGSGGVEVELQRRDGTTFLGLLNRRKVLDEEGNVQHYDAIVTDITDQKRREEARRERRQKVEALYTASVQLLRAEEAAGVAKQVHQLVAEEFGCSFGRVLFAEEDELVPRTPASDEEGAFLESRILRSSERLPAEAFRSGETRLVADLTEQPTSVDYSPLTAVAFVPMGSHGVVAIGSRGEGGIPTFDLRLLEILSAHATVVLDRIKREQKLVAAKEEAEEASRLKSALLANVSHEIRTPLTAINGFAEVLAEETEASHADLAERILKSGKRLLQTLTSLVHLSRLQAGVADLEQEPVELGTVVDDAVEMLRPRARERSLTLISDPPDSPIVGSWNEGAVKRIATNLLENAIKFTPEGGTVRIRGTVAGEEALLVVEDTGIGMRESFQDEAFEAFQQESEGVDREYEGTGLGLAVVDRFVEALGGTVTLESKAGKGTQVTVRLPLTPSSTPARPHETFSEVASSEV